MHSHPRHALSTCARSPEVLPNRRSWRGHHQVNQIPLRLRCSMAICSAIGCSALDRLGGLSELRRRGLSQAVPGDQTIAAAVRLAGGLAFPRERRLPRRSGAVVAEPGDARARFHAFVKCGPRCRGCTAGTNEIFCLSRNDAPPRPPVAWNNRGFIFEVSDNQCELFHYAATGSASVTYRCCDIRRRGLVLPIST